MQNIVSKAYSSIKADEFAKLLGMNEQQALRGISTVICATIRHLPSLRYCLSVVPFCLQVSESDYM